jgi:Leucine-rich repeat (LRR) protein
LICENNRLTEIDLSDCSELVGLVCKNNKLAKLTFNDDCNLVELRASDNEFEKIEDIFSLIKNKIEDKYSAPTLIYFDINNNKISDGKISDFAKFKNLMTLFIGNTNDNEGKNKFGGSLKDLEKLEKLEKVDIRNNGIADIKEFLNKWREEKKLKSLNRIYYSFSKKNTTEEEDKNNYDEKGNFYCKKKKGQEPAEIKSIIKFPEKLLGLRTSKNEESKSEIKDYSVDGRLIYPSEEAKFD